MLKLKRALKLIAFFDKESDPVLECFLLECFLHAINLQGFKKGVLMDFSKAFGLVYKALDYRALRQDMIASNIANVDTPFYRPKDLDFESVLAKKKAEIFENQSSKILPLAHTNPRHLDFENSAKDGASLFFRDGHLAKNDGNSVDLDIETSEMGKNSTMYLALSSALKKYRGVINYAIDSSKNL